MWEPFNFNFAAKMSLTSDEPLFSKDFYLDVAHQMDPDQNFSPDALSFLNEISDNFYEMLLNDIAKYAKNKKDSIDGIEVTEQDVKFIVENITGMAIPISMTQTEPTTFKPTAEYQEKLDAVRSFVKNKNED